MWGEFLGFLNYFGITPDKMTPLFVLGAIFVLFFIRPITKNLRRIGNAIIEIQTIMVNNNVSLSHLLTESPGSPLNPTEYGEILIKESGLERILDENKERLFSELKNTLPQQYIEYDVQEVARKVLISLKDDPIMVSVKKYAYTKGISVETILNTGGLWLRNDFLKKQRGVNKKTE